MCLTAHTAFGTALWRSHTGGQIYAGRMRSIARQARRMRHRRKGRAKKKAVYAHG